MIYRKKHSDYSIHYRCAVAAVRVYCRRLYLPTFNKSKLCGEWAKATVAGAKNRGYISRHGGVAFYNVQLSILSLFFEDTFNLVGD